MLMSRVRQKDTRPELVVRRLLHRMGYRFSTHKRQLPGTPDIYLKRHRKVVQVFGCFWHGHDCPKGKLPETRKEYWSDKIRRNKERDLRTSGELRDLGIHLLIVWECETKKTDVLISKLSEFMADGGGDPCND